MSACVRRGAVRKPSMGTVLHKIQRRRLPFIFLLFHVPPFAHLMTLISLDIPGFLPHYIFLSCLRDFHSLKEAGVWKSIYLGSFPSACVCSCYNWSRAWKGRRNLFQRSPRHPRGRCMHWIAKCFPSIFAYFDPKSQNEKKFSMCVLVKSEEKS